MFSAFLHLLQSTPFYLKAFSHGDPPLSHLLMYIDDFYLIFTHQRKTFIQAWPPTQIRNPVNLLFQATATAAAAAAAESLQSCPTLCDPKEGSPPGSPVPGILQARTLGWVAISFSNAWKWKVRVKSLSHGRLFTTPWTAASQAPPSIGFSRQEHWSGVPLPSPPLATYMIKCCLVQWSSLPERISVRCSLFTASSLGLTGTK